MSSVAAGFTSHQSDPSVARASADRVTTPLREPLAEQEPPLRIRCAGHGQDLLEVDSTEAPGYYVCVEPGCYVSVIAE
jgi:hypothetical protein